MIKIILQLALLILSLSVCPNTGIEKCFEGTVLNYWIITLPVFSVKLNKIIPIMFHFDTGNTVSVLLDQNVINRIGNNITFFEQSNNFWTPLVSQNKYTGKNILGTCFITLARVQIFKPANHQYFTL